VLPPALHTSALRAAAPCDQHWATPLCHHQHHTTCDAPRKSCGATKCPTSLTCPPTLSRPQCTCELRLRCWHQHRTPGKSCSTPLPCTTSPPLTHPQGPRTCSHAPLASSCHQCTRETTLRCWHQHHMPGECCATTTPYSTILISSPACLRANAPLLALIPHAGWVLCYHHTPPHH
jgi:hypothetical protein